MVFRMFLRHDHFKSFDVVLLKCRRYLRAAAYTFNIHTLTLVCVQMCVVGGGCPLPSPSHMTLHL